MSETEELLILNAVNGLGNRRIQKLLDAYGSARNVLCLDERRLTEDGIIPIKVARELARFPKEHFLKQELELIRKHKVRVISFQDEQYPCNLSKIADAPLVLYVRGTIPRDIDLSIGIVGSRKASLYGLSVAEKFAGELSRLGITVVSGLARGIDTSAHKGVLKTEGFTVGVLGCGLARIYPPENEYLYDEIAGNGAVISEFSMQTFPKPQNFPRRNRIISGLSLGVIVVEAMARSGALITADCALEQGREVFAVPGKLDNPASSGVNNLIKQGARLMTSVDDVLEELNIRMSGFLDRPEQIEMTDVKPPVNRLANTKAGLLAETLPVSKSSNPKAVEGLTEQEKQIYTRITERPIHVDELLNQSQMNVSIVACVLMQLELKKLVRQLPGKLYQTRNR